MKEFTCPRCGKTVEYCNTGITYDINGIPFRRVCHECEIEILNTTVYDGRDYRYDHTEEIEEVW